MAAQIRPSELTVNMSMLEECRERIRLCGCNMLFKYHRVPSFTTLKQSEALLNSIYLRTGGNVVGLGRSLVHDDWHYKLYDAAAAADDDDDDDDAH